MLQLAWTVFTVVHGDPVASPRHGKYPFVLAVIAQTFLLCRNLILKHMQCRELESCE